MANCICPTFEAADDGLDCSWRKIPVWKTQFSVQIISGYGCQRKHEW